MKEASYNSTLASKLEKEVGGQVIKLSDKATLGLPDSMHVMDGIVTFIECKLGRDSNQYVHPWKSINDLRQYETCKRLSKNALVLYAIYYPKTKMSAVLSIADLEILRPHKECAIFKGDGLVNGHGVDLIFRKITDWREQISGKVSPRIS